MSNLINLDSKCINGVDIDAIVNATKRLERLIESIETTIDNQPCNENFIEGSKIIELAKRKDNDI